METVEQLHREIDECEALLDSIASNSSGDGVVVLRLAELREILAGSRKRLEELKQSPFRIKW